MLLHLFKLVGWDLPVTVVDWNVIFHVDSVMHGGCTAKFLPLSGTSAYSLKILSASLFSAAVPGKTSSSTLSGRVLVLCCCVAVLGCRILLHVWCQKWDSCAKF